MMEFPGKVCGISRSLCDVSVKYGVTGGDKPDIIVSMDCSGVMCDRDNPGTETYIDKVEP